MKVLVTGGSGFIGRWVCDELRAAGYTPVVLDRSSGSPGTGYRSVLGDVRDATSVTEAASHVGAVIHLAGVLGTQETIANPRPAAETNILGGLNVLQACAEAQVPLVNIAVGNWFETNTYSITKHAVEQFAQMYRKYRGLNVASVRALNAYGPGQSVAVPHGSSRVRKIIPSFVSRALHGEPIQVYGDGQQVMDMVYVKDVAWALVAALGALLNGTSLPPVIEIGTGRATTVLDIAQATASAIHRQVQRLTFDIEHLPMRPGETPGVEVRADISTLDSLGLPPSGLTSLEDGLVPTVHYYRKLFGK